MRLVHRALDNHAPSEKRHPDGYVGDAGHFDRPACERSVPVTGQRCTAIPNPVPWEPSDDERLPRRGREHLLRQGKLFDPRSSPVPECRRDSPVADWVRRAQASHGRGLQLSHLRIAQRIFDRRDRPALRPRPGSPLPPPEGVVRRPACLRAVKRAPHRRR